MRKGLVIGIILVLACFNIYLVSFNLKLLSDKAQLIDTLIKADDTIHQQKATIDEQQQSILKMEDAMSTASGVMLKQQHTMQFVESVLHECVDKYEKLTGLYAQR